MLNVAKSSSKVSREARDVFPEVTEAAAEVVEVKTEAAPEAVEEAPKPRRNTAPKPAPVGGFKIEKAVPVPPTAGGGGKAKYPWAEMEVGDSFFVPGAKVETFYTLTSTARKKLSRNFIARKWQEGEISGVRVWRIED